MQKHCLLVLLIFLSAAPLLKAQSSRYAVHFTDKDTASNPYTLEEPGEYLSKRALGRRTRMGIPLRLNDLPLSPRYIDSIRPHVERIQNRSRWMNLLVVETADSLVPAISKKPFVESVKYIRPLSQKKPSSAPSSTQSTDTSRMKKEKNVSDSALYGYAWNQIQMLNGHLLHQSGYEGQDQRIAVLDAGFKNADKMVAFDSIWMNNQVVGIKDFEEHDGQVFDSHAHGTMVLSVIAANLPQVYRGTASKADFLLLRTEVNGSEYISEEYNWLAAAEYADSAGADIINSSLGYSTFDDSTQDHHYRDMDGNTTPVTRAADMAASKGILVVSSAGNQGNDPWHYIGAPADADSIIAVGAVDQNRNYASFSSTGPSYDERIKPEVAAQGISTVVQNSESLPAYANGTSFAAPIISGLMACLWQKFPDLSNWQIREKLIKNASQYANPDSLLGYGIPNFSSSAGLNLQMLGEEAIKIYPIPFKKHFFIEVPEVQLEGKPLHMEIYDILGRKIVSQPIHEAVSGSTVRINALAEYAPGMYLIKLYLDQKVIREEKILKE